MNSNKNGALTRYEKLFNCWQKVLQSLIRF